MLLHTTSNFLVLFGVFSGVDAFGLTRVHFLRLACFSLGADDDLIGNLFVTMVVSSNFC